MRSIHMVKIREILRLQSQGISILAISQSCNCSRNTVREILRTAELQGLSWPLPADMDDMARMKVIYPSTSVPASRKPEPDYQYIHEELNGHTSIYGFYGRNSRPSSLKVWPIHSSATVIGVGLPKLKQ